MAQHTSVIVAPNPVNQNFFFEWNSKMPEQELVHLRSKFDDEWVNYLTPLLEDPNIYSYGMYTDVDCTQWVANCIFEKVLLMMDDRFLPCISIKNFATLKSGKGYGIAVLEFCKQNLMSDLAGVASGIVVAECVITTQFYHTRLDDNSVAKAIQLQLCMLHDTDPQKSDVCITRSREFHFPMTAWEEED